MGSKKRKLHHNRALSRRHPDTGEAFFKSDSALQTAWERVRSTRAWMRLLDLLPDDQRRLLIHPDEIASRKKKEQ